MRIGDRYICRECGVELFIIKSSEKPKDKDRLLSCCGKVLKKKRPEPVFV
ncbi:MAG: hypothetical protein KAI70_02890 [Candidatus Omnitrophica bacterium]|nr:hypothetical protein [Candidatus Omnitrophota bacterium]